MLRRFFHSASVGPPQLIAAALLLVYMGQCLWLAHLHFRSGLRDEQQVLRIQEGLEQWRGGRIAGLPEQAQRPIPAQSGGSPGLYSPPKQDRSPLYFLIAAAPFAAWPNQLPEDRPIGCWLALAPYLFFAVMLGGSLWYVARRLYGNAGGYIVLALFCFSPAMIMGAGGRGAQGEMGAVWGAFGAVFTAIAVAHTLYAPREVVLWNWRRILLLGLSFALAVGNQFSLVPIVLFALPLMFWVAPVRPRAVVAIWMASVAVAVLLLFAAYFFHPVLFRLGMGRARWIQFVPQAFVLPQAYSSGVRNLLLGSPPLIPMLVVALVTYFGWKRARYFGNSAPLLVAVLVSVLSISAPEFPGEGFRLIILALLFVFVAGVFADLGERYGMVAMAAVWGILVASALWNLRQLAVLARS